MDLTGTDEALNVFQFDSANIYGSGSSLSQLNGINIIAPVGSTVLINVLGSNIQYGSYQIFRNGVTATRQDAQRILWNYPEALTWSNSTTAIYGWYWHLLRQLTPLSARSTATSCSIAL